MKGSRWYRRLGIPAAFTGLVCGVAFVGAGPPASGAVGFQATETPITDGQFYAADPAISGNVIVYTGENPGGGVLGTDVYYYDRDTGEHVAVTNQRGYQQLPDVSGNRIVYNDLSRNDQTDFDVLVYDVATGLTRNLTADSALPASNPVIDGDLVVWEDYRDADMEIYAADLSTGEVRRITNWVGDDAGPAVSNGTIVWVRTDGAQRDIWSYQWADGSSRPLTGTQERDEWDPAIDDNTVVYSTYTVNGEQDISAFDLVSGTERRLDLPGLQQAPDVSGNTVTFENIIAGAGSDIYAWDLSEVGTDVVAQLTHGPDSCNLASIDGNTIVYTYNGPGGQDIYLSEFSWGDTTPPSVTATVTPHANTAGWHGGAEDVLVTLTATDEAGGSGVQAITHDTDEPGTEPTTVEGDQAMVPIDNEGVTTVTYSATDTAGNTAVEGFVTVRLDRTAPVLTVPAPISVEATDADGAIVSFEALAADNLDPAPALQCAPPSGSRFAVGATTVTCAATDAAGHRTEDQFTVTVTEVAGPEQQVQAMRGYLATVPMGTYLKRPLDMQLQVVGQLIGRGRPAAASFNLRLFEAEVTLLGRRKVMPAPAATWLVQHSREVRSNLAG